MESAEPALKIIAALLKHAPPSLIWVVDGLQFAEGYSTLPYLEGFLDILRDEESNRISKVCFTTHGNSLVLLRALQVTERIDASRMRTGAGRDTCSRAAMMLTRFVGPSADAYLCAPIRDKMDPRGTKKWFGSISQLTRHPDPGSALLNYHIVL